MSVRPDSGKVERPDSGKVGRPDSGKVGRPDSGIRGRVSDRRSELTDSGMSERATAGDRRFAAPMPGAPALLVDGPLCVRQPLWFSAYTVREGDDAMFSPSRSASWTGLSWSSTFQRPTSA